MTTDPSPREIDREVAEKVMGLATWQGPEDECYEHHEPYRTIPARQCFYYTESPHVGRMVPAYSTDPAGDYEVLKRVRETWVASMLFKLGAELDERWSERNPLGHRYVPENATYYQPGDYARAALAVVQMCTLRPSPCPTCGGTKKIKTNDPNHQSAGTWDIPCPTCQPTPASESKAVPGGLTPQEQRDLQYHNRCRVAAKKIGRTLSGSAPGHGFSTIEHDEVSHYLLEWIEKQPTPASKSEATQVTQRTQEVEDLHRVVSQAMASLSPAVPVGTRWRWKYGGSGITWVYRDGRVHATKDDSSASFHDVPLEHATQLEREGTWLRLPPEPTEVYAAVQAVENKP